MNYEVQISTNTTALETNKPIKNNCEIMNSFHIRFMEFCTVMSIYSKYKSIAVKLINRTNMAVLRKTSLTFIPVNIPCSLCRLIRRQRSFSVRGAARQHFPRQVAQRFPRKLPMVKSMSNQPVLWTPDICEIKNLYQLKALMLSNFVSHKYSRYEQMLQYWFWLPVK
jgi:hypothetical protein